MLETVCNDVELQHADGSQNDIIAGQRAEHLGCAFLAQLIQSLVKRFHTQRVAQHHAPEQLRCKVGHADELERFALGEAIADANGAMVVQADECHRDKHSPPGRGRGP